MKMRPEQLARIMAQLKDLPERSALYRTKFKGLDLSKIDSEEAFETLPFTWKGDLREVYPLGLMAVPEEQIVRIHSSSGTTGVPVIIPYTRQDIADWALLFERCYRTAGVTNLDRVQITPGYGLWTAGIGFQLGAERLGAMTIPMGPGNTEKQLKMMIDMQSTVLCATASYALLLAEEIGRQGLKERIHLKKCILGSERCSERMRDKIISLLGVELYDIYGMTEIYGPGIGISCRENCGMHIWDDYLYLEIIDPKTCELLPEGEWGELVITTLRKEGAPLIRFRTHDLTRLLPGECKCGLPYPRIDTIRDRTDDMVKIKGVNIFPSQIDELLHNTLGASGEYDFLIDHNPNNGRDIGCIFVETDSGFDPKELSSRVQSAFKAKIGVAVNVVGVQHGELMRSMKKSSRIFDNRY